MRACRSRVLTALGAALVVCACASEPERLAAAKVVAGLAMSPYSIHEECITMRAGQRIGYRFIVEPAIEFNIHYHEAGAVIMPLAEKRTREEDGDFTADREQVYCLTWEADAAAAALSYRVERLPSRP